jgi:hypothetical protein
MTTAHVDGPATATCEPYRALLAVSGAIAAHRDLPALFHELAVPDGSMTWCASAGG